MTRILINEDDLPMRTSWKITGLGHTHMILRKDRHTLTVHNDQKFGVYQEGSCLFWFKDTPLSRETKKWDIIYDMKADMNLVKDVMKCLLIHLRSWNKMNAILEYKSSYFGLSKQVNRIYFETFGEYLPMKEIVPTQDWKRVQGSYKYMRSSDETTVVIRSNEYTPTLLTGYVGDIGCIQIHQVRPTLWEIKFRKDLISYESMMDLVHAMV